MYRLYSNKLINAKKKIVTIFNEKLKCYIKYYRFIFTTDFVLTIIKLHKVDYKL